MLVDGHPYAGAALLRQVVEVEYLAWAFSVRDKDAQAWLRSDKKERQKFFAPVKLREASGGKFRNKDYGYHCELGGHPTPTSRILFNNRTQTNQLLLSDLIGHAEQIWNYFVVWPNKMKT